jgi:lipopolysaccharide assembly outer membrane protein LptD (OstA)
LLLISAVNFYAQSDLKSQNTKSVSTIKDTINEQNTISKNDSVPIVTVDTLDTENDEPLEYPIIYNARDSIRYETKGQKIFLFGDGFVKYDEMNMKAEFIEIDNAKNTVTAFGKVDSTGKQEGNPVFKDGEQEHYGSRKNCYTI